MSTPMLTLTGRCQLKLAGIVEEKGSHWPGHQMAAYQPERRGRAIRRYL